MRLWLGTTLLVVIWLSTAFLQVPCQKLLSITKVSEHIEYEHKRGFWDLVTRVLFARPSLYLMFTYRKWITRRYLRRRAP